MHGGALLRYLQGHIQSPSICQPDATAPSRLFCMQCIVPLHYVYALLLLHCAILHAVWPQGMGGGRKPFEGTSFCKARVVLCWLLFQDVF